MTTQEEVNYNRIAQAIDLKANFKAQPNLDEEPENAHVSPFRFQRIFSEWRGIAMEKNHFHKGFCSERSFIVDFYFALSEVFPKGFTRR